jgi:hypothetical protein
MHGSLLTVVSATSVSLFQPLRHEQNVCNQGSVLADQTDGVTRGQVQAVRWMDVQEVPTVVLEFSPGLLGLYRV